MLELIKIFQGHNNYVIDVKFSPDHTKLISSSMDVMINIWDTNSWELLKTKLDVGYSHFLAFSPDYKTLALTPDRQIQLFNLVNTEIIESINLKTNGIYGIALLFYEKLLVMGSADKNIRNWSVS